MSTQIVYYACSKCFSRHPFEELSPGQQLCKDCRGAFPIVKCTYCRSEFQQTSKGNTSTICKKCEQSVKQYGKPTACQYCNIIAAFIGNKCQRCTNSELKYGPAVSCDQCKQRCAFDRHDESKKIDGKLLCWLCTCSYKRAVAKARQVEKEGRIVKKRPHNDKPSKEMQPSKKPQRNDMTKPLMPDIPEKVARIANSGIIDTNSSDHVVAMTELKETIASLQKKLMQKDKELLEKDKWITELKAKNFTTENELRTKMKDTERLFDTKIDILNKKIATLLKEVAVLTRSNKKSGGNNKNSNKQLLIIQDNDNSSQKDSKDSGGSGTDSPNTN